MGVRFFAGSAIGLSLGLLWATPSRAACKMDTDCPGDQVCEQEQCVAATALPPPPAAPPAAAPPAAAGAAVTPAPAAPAPAPAPAGSLSNAEAAPPPTEGRRHSRGMMVTGIVLTSVSPVGLLIWWGGVVRCGGGLDEPCDNTAQTLLGLGTFAALAGVGIPLMVIGGHREKPTPSASIGPWLSPRSAGLTVQLNL